jgi:NNP family nitrate/nitrite transporter-like MFS transporter
MSNISTFFPKRLQGTALGLNAGLGNFGVTTMQIVIPLVMTLGLFGAIGGEPMTLVKDSGWIFGKIPAGTPTWIQNAGLAWVLSLVPLGAFCWFGMNNLKTVSPDAGNPVLAFAKVTYLYTLAFVPAIFMLYLYLPAPTGRGVLNMWVAVPLDIALALLTMRLAAFGTMKDNIAKQFAIFKNKHTWSLTALYVVTFGSFIGFSMALPLAMSARVAGCMRISPAATAMRCVSALADTSTIWAWPWASKWVRGDVMGTPTKQCSKLVEGMIGALIPGVPACRSPFLLVSSPPCWPWLW